MAITRRREAPPGSGSSVLLSHSDSDLGMCLDPVVEADALADAVRVTKSKPLTRHEDLSLRRRRANLGPTAFDDHMWRTYGTGDYASLELPVSKLQAVRVRLARSQRWLTSKHQELLKDAIVKPPYTFKTSLIVTDLKGNRLAEGPVKGTLTSKALDELADDVIVVLWFRMHLPLDLGRRAKPESYT